MVKGDALRCKNQQLRKISDKERPQGKYMEAGRHLVDYIYKALQESQDLSVAKIRVAGSVGKGTAIASFEPDFDLVVFLNNAKPPFSASIIEAIEAAVRRVSSVKIKDINRLCVKIEATPLGVKIEMDILPAANLVNGPIEGAENIENKQHRAARRGQRRAKKGQKQQWSTSLAEASVSFIKDVPGGISCVIRIAKYWNKMLGGPSFHGRSYFIELVALAANLNRKSSRGVQARFTRFLNLMANVDSLSFVFTENYSVSQIDPPKQELLKERPLVMDPINPYNNVAHALTDPRNRRIKELFKAGAKHTLGRIQGAVRGDYLDVQEWFDSLQQEFKHFQ